MIKSLIKPIVPKFILDKLKSKNEMKLYQEWKEKGSTQSPPHIVKQMAIRYYQKKFQTKILVETGTYMGDMVEAQKKFFDNIFSIELGEDLYRKAVHRFHKDKHIKIVHGDSGKKLPSVLDEIKEPAIFWLDGHYSAGITAKGDKDCPIFEELNAILTHSTTEHIILIDDARCFIGKGDYPTIDALNSYILSKNPRYQIEVADDIIRYTIPS